MSDALLRIAGGRSPRIDRPPFTALVVRSDDTGVWVAPLDDDTRTPLGPCRGGVQRNAAGALELIPAGTPVLIVWTAERPWIAAVDYPTPTPEEDSGA